MTIPNNRIASIDLLRGIVMVFMALDHTREFFHYSIHFFDPTDPSQTTLPIFLTRFVTHICAPAFSFLAGLSAFISSRRKSRAQLSMLLIKRGLWLIFFELLVMNFGEHFDINFRDEVFETLWALGVSMILMAGLIHIGRLPLLVFSCVVIFGHNLLDTIHFNDNILWSFLHERNGYVIAPGHGFFIAYPLIPWPAVMALGYCFGSYYQTPVSAAQRKKILNRVGITAIMLFIVFRLFNVYGDLVPWSMYGNTSQTIISFLAVTKYPPSLDFLLITLGSSFLFLAHSENLRGRAVEFFCVFGRVPFFFYAVHIYMIHALATVAAELTGFGWKRMILVFDPDVPDPLKGFGFRLAIVYIIWICMIVVMYLVCKKFDGYKQVNKEKWWATYF